VNQPFTAKGEERQEKLVKFVRNLGAIGAAVIAGVDLEGRPGLTYRVSHAGTAAARTASRTAREAQTAATLASYRAAKRARKAARDSQRALAAARS
jgi:hypothetical protein